MNPDYSVNIHPAAAGDSEMFDFDFDTAMAHSESPSFNQTNPSGPTDFDYSSTSQLTAPIDIAYQKTSSFGYRNQPQPQNIPNRSNQNNNNNVVANNNDNNNNNMNSINQFLNNPRLRRESIAHTQGMGGVSFGSLTIGSWLKDEVLFHHNHGNLMNNGNQNNQVQVNNQSQVNNNNNNQNFNLLGNLNNNNNNQNFNINNDLMMAMSPPQVNYLPNLEADYCKDYSCCGHILPTLHDLLRHYEEAHISVSPPNELNNDSSTKKRPNDLMEAVSTNEVFLSNVNNNNNNLSNNIQLNSINNNMLGLDNRLLNSNNLDINQVPQQNSSLFTFNNNNSTSNNNLLNNQVKQQNDNGFGFGNSENSSNLSSNLHSQFNQNNSNFPNNSGGDALQNKPIIPTNLINSNNLGQIKKEGDDDEICIDDPARHLYVEGENRPFKCPVNGCDKTYKNQNGLKYHKAHGHQNQKLFENPDGSFSVIDPESNQPYPDGSFNMEKDKPFRCEVCGKRYKNLNGLKYHRGHSTH